MSTASAPTPARFVAIAAPMRAADQIAVAAVPLMGAAVFGAPPDVIGIMVATQGAAPLLVALPAGVWIDRVSPYVALRILLVGVVLGYLALGLGLVTGQVALFTFGAFVAAGSTIAAFLAEMSSVQRATARADLPRVNARIQLAQSVAMFVCPLVVGWATSTGRPIVALVSGLLCAVAAVAIAWGLPRELPTERKERHALRELREGLSFVKAEPHLRAIVACALFWNMAAFALAALFAPYALARLTMSPDAVGFALAGAGVGSIAAALLAARVLDVVAPRLVLFFGPASSVVAACLVLGAGSIATDARMATAITFAAYVLIGFGPILWFVTQNTIRQLVTPPDLLARVGSVITVAIYGVRSFGALAGGLVGARYGFEAGLWLVIALFAASTLVVPATILGRLAALPVRQPS